MAANVAVQNSNLNGKLAIRGIKNLCRKKGGTQNNSPLTASVLYSRECRAAGPYSLCGLRSIAAKVVVQNSNLNGKSAVRRIKNLCRKKEELKRTH